MPRNYISDRERGSAPRLGEEISESAWGGIVALIHNYISNGGFGIDFPVTCPDGSGPFGTDENAFGLAVQGEIPGIVYPLRSHEHPGTYPALDLLEFCYEHVAVPIPGSHHPFFDHQHLNFDRDRGREEFRQKTERILARNGLIYEMREDGTIARIAAPIMRESLLNNSFATGDEILDELLDTARIKFLNADPAIRREALEKLWDAWERLKSLENPENKRESTKILLDRASQEPNFRQILEVEAKTLTDFGNGFRIRHSETNRLELESDKHADYMFYRLLALIWFLVRSRS